MAKRKEVVEPVVIPVGKCGEFEVTYRRVAGDEGPAAEFYGLIDGKRVKLLRFDYFEKDPHYHYNPDTPRDRKYSIDPVIFSSKQCHGISLIDFASIVDRLVDMVKTAGHPGLASKIRRQSDWSIVEQVLDAMEALRRQQKRKTKK